MADLADVENALKAIVLGAIYKNGTGAPSVMLHNAAPLAAAICRGWPNKEQLKRDLAAGLVVVSVYPMPGGERVTNRYSREWEDMAPLAHSITAVRSGVTVTLGGTVTTPQNVAIVADGATYIHAVQPGDTLATIAAALAALISEDQTATSVGPVITVPGSHELAGRVGNAGNVIREHRRQERLFQVTCWCSTPEHRDTAAPFVEGAFAGVGLEDGRDFITLPDTQKARLQYVRTLPTDGVQLEGVFRRDTLYSVEYATTEIATAPEIVGIDLPGWAPFNVHHVED
jgi:hypothetical protein